MLMMLLGRSSFQKNWEKVVFGEGRTMIYLVVSFAIEYHRAQHEKHDPQTASIKSPAPHQ